jgi:vanillate O-demethylase monooxygenase subunit
LTRAGQTWLSNAWYVAGTPDEIADKPLGRRICGQAMVIFRAPDGEIAALDDFCPHRGAPLSLGFVEGENLVCGYHGLAVNCTGRVAGMPGQRVETFPRVRRFPAVQRYGFIWVWPGDPEAADPDQLPALTWAESEQWTYGGGLYHVAADYRLMVDNLMDLTHETYVHASSIGQREINEAPVLTRTTDHEVVTSRFIDGITPPPFHAMALRGAGLPDEGPVDRWQICRFSLPSHVMIEVGVALAGHGGYDAPDTLKTNMIVVDFMTPETETSHWYFWGMARRFKVDDQALTDSIRTGQGGIFAEDMEMLQRQQANLSDNPQRRLLNLNIDSGGVHSRLMITRAIARERVATADVEPSVDLQRPLDRSVRAPKA